MNSPCTIFLIVNYILILSSHTYICILEVVFTQVSMTPQLIIFCRRDGVAGLVVMRRRFHLRHSKKGAICVKRDILLRGEIEGGVLYSWIC